MSDLPVPRGYLTEATDEIRRMHLDIQLQERKSRIVRLKQDIEDIIKGKILDLESHVKMLEKDVEFLEIEREKAKGLHNVIEGEIISRG